MANRLRALVRRSAARLLLPVLALLGASPPAGAAEEDVRLWSTLSGSQRLSEDWEFGLLVQTRFADDISELERVSVRPSVTRRIESLGGGVALGYDAHIVRYPRNRVENRIWQQLSASHALWGAKIAHRLRLEERFLEDVSGVALRLRYSLGGSHPLGATRVNGIVRDEIFFDLNSPASGPQAGFGENRVFAGIGLPLPGPFRMELGYQLQYVDRPRMPNAANHILMVTLAFSR